MTSYYTTGNGVTVLANESEPKLGGRISAEVTFPNADLDPVTILKPYADLAAAKLAAQAIAAEINRIAPRGFPRLRGSYRDADKTARAQVEALAREWAGPEAVIVEIED